MYTNMEQWSEIRRRVLVEGASKRSIQREYKIHWKTLQKMLQEPEPPGVNVGRLKNLAKKVANARAVHYCRVNL